MPTKGKGKKVRAQVPKSALSNKTLQSILAGNLLQTQDQYARDAVAYAFMGGYGKSAGSGGAAAGMTPEEAQLQRDKMDLERRKLDVSQGSTVADLASQLEALGLKRSEAQQAATMANYGYDTQGRQLDTQGRQLDVRDWQFGSDQTAKGAYGSEATRRGFAETGSQRNDILGLRHDIQLGRSDVATQLQNALAGYGITQKDYENQAYASGLQNQLERQGVDLEGRALQLQLAQQGGGGAGGGIGNALYGGPAVNPRVQNYLNSLNTAKQKPALFGGLGWQNRPAAKPSLGGGRVNIYR